jgi:hypothetical protein
MSHPLQTVEPNNRSERMELNYFLKIIQRHQSRHTTGWGKG